MAGLTLQIEGALGTISVSAFTEAVKNFWAMLRDIDAGVSGVQKGSLNWAITNLSTGSLAIQAEPTPRDARKRNYAPDVMHQSVRGLTILERDGLTPPYLTDSGMNNARSFVKLIGRDGVTGYRIANTSESIVLTASASANIEQLLPTRYTTIGSVEGRLEAINLHGRKPRLIVYHAITRKAVTCNFDASDIEAAKSALGKRVVVAGDVEYNAKHEPLRIRGSSISEMPLDSDLPNVASMKGRIPDLTGAISTEEYIRSIRGE
jgi:hypothetical protein